MNTDVGGGGGPAVAVAFWRDLMTTIGPGGDMASGRGRIRRGGRGGASAMVACRWVRGREVRLCCTCREDQEVSRRRRGVNGVSRDGRQRWDVSWIWQVVPAG